MTGDQFDKLGVFALAIVVIRELFAVIRILLSKMNGKAKCEKKDDKGTS